MMTREIMIKIKKIQRIFYILFIFFKNKRSVFFKILLLSQIRCGVDARREGQHVNIEFTFRPLNNQSIILKYS